MPVLLCRHIDRRIDWKVELADADFTLGCSEQATVPVPDPTLAPREVAIARKGDRWLLQDLVEKGHVVLGGTVTRAGLLKDGDRFRVGRISIVFFEKPTIPGGQVELLREAQPSFDLLEGPLVPAVSRREERVLEDEVIPRGVWVGVLVLAVFAGLCLGILYWSASGAGQRGLSGAGSGGSEAQSRKPAGATQGEAKPGVAAGRDPSLLVTADPPTRGQVGTEAQKSTAQRLAPPRYQVEVAAPRLQVFRLFLDLVGRPPTRGEERELLPLTHGPRWQRALEVGKREGTLPDLGSTVEAQFQAFLGRKPTVDELDELRKLVTPDLPPAYWISSLEEYRRPDRRRERSSLLRARSLIVDILDRPPANEKELEAVRSAITSPENLLETARTLAHSTRGKQALLEPGFNPDEEVFRYLLREPTPAERNELATRFEKLEPSARRARLLVALATHEEYARY